MRSRNTKLGVLKRWPPIHWTDSTVALPEAALDILEQNGHRYDPAVIAALRGVAGSVTGEKLIAGLAAG